MSLVENLVEQLASSNLNITTKPSGFNLDDDTFAKLLEKQLQQNSKINNISEQQMGIPAGFEIESFDNSTTDNKTINFRDTEIMQQIDNQKIEIKDVKLCDVFSSYIKDSADRNSTLFNFAKRNATNSYEVFGKSYVTDLKDFVEDINTKN